MKSLQSIMNTEKIRIMENPSGPTKISQISGRFFYFIQINISAMKPIFVFLIFLLFFSKNYSQIIERAVITKLQAMQIQILITPEDLKAP